METFGFACVELGLGDVVPGDLERGVAYRCELGLDEKGREVVVFGLDCGCCDEDVESPVALVVIVLAPDEVTVAVVVETCAAATSEPGDTASYVDFAWKVGFVCALKAEKKLAKKGRLVGILLVYLAVWRTAPEGTGRLLPPRNRVRLYSRDPTR